MGKQVTGKQMIGKITSVHRRSSPRHLSYPELASICLEKVCSPSGLTLHHSSAQQDVVVVDAKSIVSQLLDSSLGGVCSCRIQTSVRQHC